MGTLMIVNMAMDFNSDIAKLKIAGKDNEILLDINGDKKAEVALQDCNQDGNIDRIAFDVTGDGKFDLYIDDTDGNNIPDRIYTRDASGKEEVLAAGPELEKKILSIAEEVGTMIVEGKDVGEELVKRLSALDGEIAKIAQAK